MKLIEIDHIEVTDTILEVFYWLSGHKDCQSIMFKTADFEGWLQKQRDVSLGSYWDHWNNKLSHQIMLDDVRQYLTFKFGMIKPIIENTASSYSHKKPMKRVSDVSSGKSGSKSA